MEKTITTKVIWIDLDEVLSESLDQILEDNNYILWWKLVSREDFLDYDVFKVKDLNLSFEQWLNYFHWVYLNDIDLRIKPVIDSKSKLQEFKNKWYTLKIVTWRPEYIEEYTLNWIDKHFSNFFDSIHFANHYSYWNKVKTKRNKSEICKELWITFMIEDRFDYALELAQNWIFTYLIEKPWNKHIILEHSNIKKVKNWQEIVI